MPVFIVGFRTKRDVCMERKKIDNAELLYAHNDVVPTRVRRIRDNVHERWTPTRRRRNIV